MVTSGKTRLLAGAVAVAVVAVVAPVLVGAQVGTSFPAPVIAPGSAGAPPGPADVVAFYRDPAVPVAEPVVVVELTTPVPSLPDGTRVSVVTGDPNGDQLRTTLRWEAGTPSGEAEAGGPEGFGPLEDAPPPLAEITATGHARLGVQAGAGDAGVWVETETAEGAVSRTPVFPLSQVIESAGPGALAPATVAAMSGPDNVPTGEWMELTAVPTLEARPQDITVRTTQPIPTEVAGLPVREVRDFLRIAPSFGDVTQAPYFVFIDYTAGTVTYLDSSGGIPVAVAGPESAWLVDGLDEGDAETSSVVLDRAGLLEAAGLPADVDVAIGVSRAVVFEDGRYLTAEGPLALLSWFGAGAGVEVTPTTAVSTPTPTTAPAPTATVAAAAGDDGGPNATVLVAAAAIAVVLAGVALYASRQNRRALLGDPDSALDAMAKVVDKTAPHESEGDGDEAAGGGSTPRRPPPAGGGVRVPTPRDRAVAEAVGVKGARAAVSREAQARAAAQRDQDEPGRDAPVGEVGRDALWAAMRKKAAEAAAGDAADDGASASGGGDAADPGGPTTAGGDGAGGDPAPGATKGTDPDEALDALNRFIEDLHLPGDR